jgi:hypothetical protein
MPLQAMSRRSRRVSLVVAFVTYAATIGLAALPASASSTLVTTLLPNCGARVEATPFRAWSDTHSYFLMPGGDFESGAAGWTLTGGSAVVGGSESFLTNHATDSHSLKMVAGSVAASPTICVAMGENSARLFVKSSGGASSVLHVQVYVQNRLTGLVLSTGFDVAGNATRNVWTPSPRLFVPNLLGGVLGDQNLTVVFTTKGAPATWNIDDVYVDPFKSR